MSSISCSKEAAVRFAVPLNAMCSRKCAVPFVSLDSYRDPASIQTPTVAVSLYGVASVATRKPDGKVVTYAFVRSENQRENECERLADDLHETKRDE